MCIRDRFRIDDLASPKTHGYFHLVFLLQEFLDLPDLKIQVMFLGFGAELNLFGFYNRLLLFRFLLLFTQLIAIFVKIH